MGESEVLLKKKIQRKIFGRLKCRGNGNQQKTRKLMN